MSETFTIRPNWNEIKEKWHDKAYVLRVDIILWQDAIRAFFTIYSDSVLFPSPEINMHNYILRNKMLPRVMVHLFSPLFIGFSDISTREKKNPCGLYSYTMEEKLQTLRTRSHRALLQVPDSHTWSQSQRCHTIDAGDIQVSSSNEI